MPLLTRLRCDGRLGNGKNCQVAFYIGEPETMKESAQVLQIIDAMGKKLTFHDIDCLRRWAASYTCPYVDLHASDDDGNT